MLRCAFILVFSATVLNIVSSEIYRLPQNVKPLRYFLSVEPHLHDDKSLDAYYFNGSVIIELIILVNTKNITLHQSDLDIDSTSIKITDSNSRILRPVSTLTDESTETYTIQFEDELGNDEKYSLTIGNFSGVLGIGEGFFWAAYYKNGDKRRLLAATHFEPSNARRAFPCFDEPALKATFIVTVIRQKEYISISNTDLYATKNLGDGRFQDTFKETPIMSTFTLAFAVCDYKSTKKVGRQRVYANPNAIDDGEADYALEIGIKTLKALEEFTKIDFAIDKMDQFVVPNRFFYENAMENWGLVIYGQTYLLRNYFSSAQDFKTTTCYIAHEYAHQWFGNLVTPAWWDFLWLSESFATYFQYYGASLVQPTWRLMDQFVIDVLQTAFKLEVNIGPHPLNYKIKRSGTYPPFHIMYEKGAAIIRMMEHFLTLEVFRKGLQIYLETNKYATAVPKDLYNSVQKAVDLAATNGLLSNMTVGEIMEVWDSTKGFPIVTVNRNYQTGDVTIQQKSQFDGSNSNTKWIIPMNFMFSFRDEFDFSKTNADYWLTEKSGTIQSNNFSVNGLLIVNKQQTGYYRVNYDLENWERIIEFMNSENFTLIHVLNRAQLINDAFNLAHLKEIPWEIPFRLGEYIIRERDYIPLASFYEALDSLSFRNTKISESEYFGNYTLSNVIFTEEPTELGALIKYVKTVLNGVKDSLGFTPKPNDTHIDELHRNKLSPISFSFN